MFQRVLAGAVVMAALAMPAMATDTSSLAAFVQSCSADMKGCRLVALNAVNSARSANYGCIPKDISSDSASERLLDWIRGTAAKDPKYANEALPDLMWTGIDELWPCKK